MKHHIVTLTFCAAALCATNAQAKNVKVDAVGQFIDATGLDTHQILTPDLVKA